MINEPKNLNPRLTGRLLTYVTVAGAAATCATQARAEVVYTPVNDRAIHSNYLLDLNNDGFADFQITSYEFSDEGEVQVFARPGNRMVAVSFPCGPQSDSPAAAPLQAGAVVGQGKPFQHDATCMAFSLYGGNGPWFLLKDHYLGFAFNINGKEHFGWARITVGRFTFNHTATLSGYAYETTPGKPIIAGDEGSTSESVIEPMNLGALALGSQGLSLWRREEGQ